MSNRYILILDWCGAVTPYPGTASASIEEAAGKVPDGNHIGRWYVYDTKRRSRVKKL